MLSGLSKIAALPQMKVGWIVGLGPQNQRREAMQRLEVIADTFLSMNAPAQHALPTWLSTRHGIRSQIIERVRENLGTARSVAGLQVLRADAGWNAIVRLPQLGGGETPALSLVGEAGVLAHPGSFYGLAGEHFVVLSTIGPAEKFRNGLKAMKEWSESRG